MPERLTAAQKTILLGVARASICAAVSQRAVTQAIKRARFMALMPYAGD